MHSHIADTTDALWSATHTALMAGHWSQGQRLLEQLGRRGDVLDALCSLETYQRAARLEGRNDLSDRKFWQLRVMLQDRIDQINWRIDNRADGY